MDRIVVGVDGSERSAAALEWAVEEARLRDAAVEAVLVYQSEIVPAYGDAIVAASLMEGVTEAAAEDARKALAEVVAGVEAQGVTITEVTLDDPNPAGALVERARDATLLVVGSRGLGGFRELVLGSVSHQCANRAHCPVVIIRHEG